MKLQGVYTALVTPFLADGKLDREGLRKNIRHQIAGGVAGIVPLGTTGETPTLTKAEADEVLKISFEEAHGKVQIIVGVGTNATATTVENTLRAKEMGADAVLVVTPYYNKPTQAGIIQHFQAIQNVGIPFIVYNIPGRTGTMIETATLRTISEMSFCQGVKEATGSVSNMSEVLSEIALTNPRFQVLSGDDALTLPLMAIGGTGVISVISNLFPKAYSEMCALAQKGDYAAARKIHFQLAPLFRALFIESNPIPAKYGMQKLGLAAGAPRLPLIVITDTGRRTMDAALDFALKNGVQNTAERT